MKRPCDAGHEMIWHTGDECPLCAERKRSSQLEYAIQSPLDDAAGRGQNQLVDELQRCRKAITYGLAKCPDCRGLGVHFYRHESGRVDMKNCESCNGEGWQ